MAALEAAERREKAERIRAARQRYETWEAVLADGAAGWVEHQRRTVWVDQLAILAESSSDPALAAFVDWSRAHLAAANPLRTLVAPSGEAPG